MGDVLLDDVRLENTTRKTRKASWFEYWDVNPYNQEIASPGTRGVSTPSWNRRARTLVVAQSGGRADDNDPLSIFGADLFGNALPAPRGNGPGPARKMIR